MRMQLISRDPFYCSQCGLGAEMMLGPLIGRIEHWRGSASPGRNRCRRLIAMLLCAGWLPQAPSQAAIPDIAFTAASVEYGDTRLEEVRAELAQGSFFSLEFARMTGPAEPWLGGGLAVRGEVGSLVMDDGVLELDSSIELRGLSGRVSVKDRGGERLLTLSTRNQPLSSLVNWPGLPEQAKWLRGGQLDALLTIRQSANLRVSLGAQFDLNGLGFDSPDGSYAAEGLDLQLRFDWPDMELADAALGGVLRSGELLIRDFYRDFSGGALNFSSDLEWSDKLLELARFSLGDDRALDVQGRVQVDLERASNSWEVEVTRLELNFPAAYEAYIEPLAAAWTLNGLEVTGRLLWSGEWSSGNLVSGDLEIGDLSIVDSQRHRFAFTGLQAQLRPGDYEFSSRLAWRGLLLGRINLGAGEAAIDSEPGALALEQPLILDMLGGQVELSVLKIILPGSRADGTGEPDVMLRARVKELDMGQLTSALDWPPFSGKVSGEIPGVSLDDDVLSVDGEIRLDVFDGRISLQNLSLERAFGVLPGLAADMQITNLDLEKLTQTFSFGRIAGRLDGHVNELRMLDWKPVAFDAWLGTPSGQGGSRDISRQAVNRLTTLGGGSATTALTSPVMRLFNNFSYKRLGLGCRLQNNTCQLRGLSEDEASVLLLEGAGVPKITIRAYNRNIDWPQMVSNLLAVSADGEVRIGD
jgi:hypothetical protein